MDGEKDLEPLTISKISKVGDALFISIMIYFQTCFKSEVLVIWYKCLLYHWPSTRHSAYLLELLAITLLLNSRQWLQKVNLVNQHMPYRIKKLRVRISMTYGLAQVMVGVHLILSNWLHFCSTSSKLKFLVYNWWLHWRWNLDRIIWLCWWPWRQKHL